MPPGGGGLVILPQKSWNVWRNDNKERVARDKKKHEAEQNARRKRQHEVEAEIRLERLRGKDVSNDEAQRRIQEAVDSMNLDDYIETKTMKELADEHTRRLERQLDRPHKRRRLNSNNPFSKPRNDEQKERQVEQKEDFSATSVPFNLFAGQESRGGRRQRRSLEKNPEREEEEKKIKEREENQRALAHSSVEKAKNIPWYLVTDPEEIERRKPMLPENHQNALPKRHRDFNRDARHIANRNARKKRQHDPLMEMDDILGQRPQVEASDEPSRPLRNYSDCSTNFRELMSRFDHLDDNPTPLERKKKKKKKSSSKKKGHKSKKKKKKKRRRDESDSSSPSDNETPRKRRRSESKNEHEEIPENAQLEKLRQERVAREAKERKRTRRLNVW